MTGREQRMAARGHARAEREAKAAKARAILLAKPRFARPTRFRTGRGRRATAAKLEAARNRLRSPTPDERLDAISDVADLDPVVATRELDNLLRGAGANDDVRMEAFGKLKDLTDERPADG